MTATNDQSLPFHVTVRRNQGPRKFYSGAATKDEAQKIAADRNAKEVLLRAKRAAERAQTVGECDKYTYEVMQK